MALWEPSEEDYVKIRQLAELGWPSPKISEALDLTPQQFAGGLVRYPRMKAEYDQGVNDCKAFLERRLAWMPSVEDLEQVRNHAKRGLNHDAIAAKLKVSRRAFAMRIADTPQLLDAWEEGNGEYQAIRIEEFNQLVDLQDESLKFVGASYTNILKTQCGWTDKGAQKAEPIQVDVKHTHSFKAPKPVATVDVVEFARIEMEKATRESAEKLKASMAQFEIIEVASKEVEDA